MEASKTFRSMRGTISSLASSKGAVYVNPDGTLVYLNPLKGEQFKQERASVQSQPGQLILPVFGDDELAFFISPSDLPEFVDEVIETYLTHSKVFLIFLITQLIIEALFDYLIYSNQERALKQLALIYTKVPSDEIQRMFVICLMTDIVYFAIYYPIGFWGTYRKSHKILNTFAVLSIVGIFVQVFLSYINKQYEYYNRFNMLLFFFRIFSYIYSKFLSHLILNLILLPH